ncbi:GGDEF domain-containing protein [Oryzifoliimicrobium ureilyticus]|uniref:GGDEF domain-containing protein n=1 Tax=Oryzifoliimicrobium ureilyticus TaxID=3113724 RepID=UPI0030765905
MSAASTLAGMGEQGTLALVLWAFGSFSIGITGYSLLAAGLLRLSRRNQKLSDWGLPVAALLLSALVFQMDWYEDNETRGAIFNIAVSAFLGLSGLKILADFWKDRLPSRLGLFFALVAAAAFCALVALGMTFPAYAQIEPRYAFFLLIICHFSLALFVVVFVQERTESQLRQLAGTDALTGIPNRQHFLACLERAPQTGDAFIMIDIDHFKRINDMHGHRMGDTVLIGVAQTLAAIAGKETAFGRLGGEEFALLLTNQTEKIALAKAEQLRQAINALSFSTHAMPVKTSASIGVAFWRGAGDLQSLQDQADQALYTAKGSGRDQVVLYRGEPRPRLGSKGSNEGPITNPDHSKRPQKPSGNRRVAG